MKTLGIPGALIFDDKSFHKVFAEAFGFPQLYGNNWTAWIDCMGYLDDPDAAMTTVHVPVGGQLSIRIDDAETMKMNCPEIWLRMLESAAFVNWRCAARSGNGLLLISANI